MAPWTVLFDWNGTLVDDVSRSYVAVCAVLESRALPNIGLAQFRDRFQLPLSVFFAGLGVPGPVCPAAEAQWNALITGLPAILRPGAADLLRSLAGTGSVLGVISAASAGAVTADLFATGIADLFDLVLGGVADKSSALRAFTAHRSAPRVAYVGDTEYDMAAARNAGALAIGVSGGYRPLHALRSAAHHVAADLTQIPSLLAMNPSPSPPAPVSASRRCATDNTPGTHIQPTEESP
jgi:phosphoglycolate phosphatase